MSRNSAYDTFLRMLIQASHLIKCNRKKLIVLWIVCHLYFRLSFLIKCAIFFTLFHEKFQTSNSNGGNPILYAMSKYISCIKNYMHLLLNGYIKATGILCVMCVPFFEFYYKLYFRALNSWIGGLTNMQSV